MLHRATRPMWPLALLAGSVLAVGAARAQNVSAPPQSKIIDEHLTKAWADNKVTPAKRSTDNEFIRRVFIDILGRIPAAEEVRDFERDKSANKRAKLIHRLLHDEGYKPKDAGGKEIKTEDGKTVVYPYTEQYAYHWAEIWTVWLMTRGGTNEKYHDEMEKWLFAQFLRNKPHDEIVRALLTASGQYEKNGAVNFIMAHLGEQSPGDRRVSDGRFDSIPITSRVTRLFLGIQTQCTQCHDHPFNPEWGQENFWGVNAFFRSTDRKTPGDAPPTPPNGARRKKDKNTPVIDVSIADEPKLNESTRIYYERRTGLLMSIKPSFLPDLADLEKDKSERAKKLLPPVGGKTRREVLADYVTAHDNFSKAFVNRLWAHFFGRGMNEQPAPDDFGGHNKLLHPQLLEELGKEFAKYKYDPKMLIEWICNSEAYNLSYVAASKDMAKPEFDVYFARMPLKAMSPEVLLWSLTTATRTDQQLSREAREEKRAAWMDRLVRNFGDDEGNEMTFNGTIVQALLMMNGQDLNGEIRSGDGLVAKTVSKALKMPANTRDQFLIDEIYMTALARRPSTTTIIEVDNIDAKTKRKTVAKMTEAAFVMKQLQDAKGKPTAKVDPKIDPKTEPKTIYQAFGEDLFWSLLNTNEFMLNH